MNQDASIEICWKSVAAERRPDLLTETAFFEVLSARPGTLLRALASATTRDRGRRAQDRLALEARRVE